jgi:cytochrome c oxidase assembly protein subunit 15
MRIPTDMSGPTYNPWLHRLAVATACVALLPILMGALVTTKDAGMAFKDWPSSDGHNMLAYPWLKSAGDKFLEHGHRLAGVLIGLTSIVLVVVAGLVEQRRWVKVMAGSVLVAVIAQGLLGGSRVLLDERGLAFVHGSVAALVMALMVSLAVVTSRCWFSQLPNSTDGRFHRLQLLAWATCAIVFFQYVLGGLLRHRGMVLYEHLGFAFVAALMVVWLAMSAAASGAAWLRVPAACLVCLTLVQLALGAGAWVAKFGFEGYVAVYGSPVQVTVRTGHVLGGMLLFVTAVLLTMRITRLNWLCSHSMRTDVPIGSLDSGMPLAGGAR